MKKSYRKIIVNNKEYDWLHIRTYGRNEILIFNIEYLYDYKSSKDIRKRKLYKIYDIDDYCENNINSLKLNITPNIAKLFIEYIPGTGKYIITNSYLRKQKLLKINKT